MADVGFGAEGEEVAAEGEGSFMDEMEKEATSESALISRLADKVQEEWITGGKLTQEQIDAYWEKQEAEYDPSGDYMPEVWQEATNRWNGMTPDVRAAQFARFSRTTTAMKWMPKCSRFPKMKQGMDRFEHHR